MDGDLKSAIEQYRKVAQSRDRSVAARALVRMGECYEKLGDAEARKPFERVVREFGDQKDSLEAARLRLVALGRPSSGPTTRLVAKGNYILQSPDGHFLLQAGTDRGLDLRDLQTGQVRRITRQPWDYASASRDGRQVAFLMYANDAMELRVAGADGSGERLLWRADKGRVGWGLQWSPDDRRITVTTAYPKNEVIRIVAVSVADGVVATLLEGKELGDAQFSPDFKSVVYSKRVRQNPVADELWLMRVEDHSETLLFQGLSDAEYPLYR